MPRTAKPPEPRPANLSASQMRLAIQKIDRRLEDISAFEVNSVHDRRDPRIGVLSNRLDALLVEIFGHETIEYNRYRWNITQLDTAPHNLMYETPLYEVQEGLSRGLLQARAELEAIKLDFHERLQDSAVPSEHLAPNGSLGSLPLHPEILRRCRTLYDMGAYPEAAECSFKIVRDKLRKLTGYETGSEAFGKGRLSIRGASAPNVETDFNEGVKFLTMAIDKFRNEKAHTSEGNLSDPGHTVQYLIVSSLALRFLERAEIRNA